MRLAPALLVVLAAFLVGAIPFSFLLARLLGGVDIRRVGSGNIGATNLARTLGIGAGIVGLLLDAAKGLAAILLSRALAGGEVHRPEIEAIAGTVAVLGHMYPPFLKFRGGKGVATGAGVFGLLAPRALLVAVAVFLLVVIVTRIVSLGSILAAASLPVAAHCRGSGREVVWASILIGALVIARHRSNLLRIARGSERRLGADRDPAADDSTARTG